MKEPLQMEDLHVCRPVHEVELTQDEKKNAVDSPMLPTKRRSREVKVRQVADGSEWRTCEGHNKHDTPSPTVSNEGVFVASVMEVHEHGSVVMMDLPGSFLDTVTEEVGNMKLKGRLAKLMAVADSLLHRKHVMCDNRGIPTLCVRLGKALCGLLVAVLEFHKKLHAELEADGFEVNPCGPCVANKIMDDTHVTVCWHADDLKVSHAKPAVMVKFTKCLERTHGDKMAVNTGDVNGCLGMDPDCSSPGSVKVGVIKHLREIVRDFPESLNGSAAMPSVDHLFKIRDETEAECLPEEQAIACHHTVAQLLFLSQRPRRDFQTDVPLFTARTKKPDEDDWGKLRRCLLCSKGMRHLNLTLSVDEDGVMKWWVAVSHCAHADCKGHTRHMMNLSKGAVISGSKRQKSNVMSSTESELAGADDALPKTMHAKLFIEAQGNKILWNMLHQDNQATMRLEINGRSSGTPSHQAH